MDRQTDWQMGMQAGRQTDRQTHTQRHKHRQTAMEGRMNRRKDEQTDIQTDRDRHTDRQTDWHCRTTDTDRQIDTQIGRQTVIPRRLRQLIKYHLVVQQTSLLTFYFCFLIDKCSIFLCNRFNKSRWFASNVYNRDTTKTSFEDTFRYI